ncbi:MAG: hypothetical protein QW568_02075 [Candidatus Anstonellaceae archaeon]
MGVWRPEANSSVAILKQTALRRLDVVENNARTKIITDGMVNSAWAKARLVRKMIEATDDEDRLYSAVRSISAIERELTEPGASVYSPTAKVAHPTGNRSRFFDYMMEDRVPESFVEPAIKFEEEMAGFGWKLFVDCGLVLGSNTAYSDFVAGFMSADVTRHPQVLSEMPSWKRRWLQEGNLEGFSCSIKFSDRALGLGNRESKAYVIASLMHTGDRNRLFFRQMESVSRFLGFSLELNETGKNLHIYFAQGSRMLSAHLISGELYVPPEAWLSSRK